MTIVEFLNKKIDEYNEAESATVAHGDTIGECLNNLNEAEGGTRNLYLEDALEEFFSTFSTISSDSDPVPPDPGEVH